MIHCWVDGMTFVWTRHDMIAFCRKSKPDVQDLVWIDLYRGHAARLWCHIAGNKTLKQTKQAKLIFALGQRFLRPTVSKLDRGRAEPLTHLLLRIRKTCHLASRAHLSTPKNFAPGHKRF